MLSPIKVLDIELSQPIVTVEGLSGYIGLQGLLRWQGTPLGYIQAPIHNGRCEATTLGQCILEQRDAILRQLLVNALLIGKTGCAVADLLKLSPPPALKPCLSVTVAICTRNRPADLARCLDALCQLHYSALELLVIDNAPSSDATEKLVQQYPQVRYVQEPRPGLDWARNRAILEARSEIIAYTDDDVIVDTNWVQALAQVFAENPEVMAVTGLVVPAELETDAQVLFEMNGGFGKGFQRRWWHFPQGKGMHWTNLGTGNLGTGANMAFRRSVFHSVGYFDPALDVGTVTHGAGDLEMFFRVLKSGHAFVYEPAAIVRHRHRREYSQLRSQLRNNGSVFASFVRSALAYPDTTRDFIWLGLSWLKSGHIGPLLTSLFYPARFPRDLRMAQLWGCLVGLTTYLPAQRRAAEVAQTYGDLPALSSFELDEKQSAPAQSLSLHPEAALGNGRESADLRPLVAPNAIAIRTLELSQPLTALTDVACFGRTRLFVTWNGSPVGQVDITNRHQPISVMRLNQAVIEQLGWKTLLDLDQIHRKTAMAEAVTSLKQFFGPVEPEAMPKLLSNVSVSILVATYDRPDDLQNCLRGLLAQVSPRSIEIIVVDNHPASGLTAPVMAAFSTVKLVNEARQGVAYARNAGIAASRGEIIVTVDDDVTVPPDWLEKLLAPFARADVMAVTGNVLPVELDTDSQQLFEQYGNGGLGRGFNRFEVNRTWFERSWMHAVPTWELGGTANSAYRASVFCDPGIGLMDEALGPGMPSGVGEDIYLFYKILKAGGTILYEPTAYLWHKHRRDLSALQRQLYNYSKGFVSYQLTTLLRDYDYRSLVTLFLFLPLHHLKQFLQWLKGNRVYPVSLIGLEIAGNLAGAWSLWRSRQRVHRTGRSSPYVPFDQRQHPNGSSSRISTASSKLPLASRSTLPSPLAQIPAPGADSASPSQTTEDAVIP